jgi:hypothetical protein
MLGTEHFRSDLQANKCKVNQEMSPLLNRTCMAAAKTKSAVCHLNVDKCLKCAGTQIIRCIPSNYNLNYN